MQGDVLTLVLLPAGLMFIMFSLGIGLTVADFRRVFANPRAFAVGALCHFVLLPLVAFALLKLWGLSGALAVGFMIVAACPTGTTSNMLTYYARGDVALALSFTAFAGLVSIVTVPFIVGASIGHFIGEARDVAFPAGTMMGQIFIVIGVPVIVGMLVRARWPGFVSRWQARLGLVAAIVFVVIVAASIFKHRALFATHLASLAPIVLSINAILLVLGYGLSRAIGVERRQAVTVAIESSVQNVTLAIVIASTILRDDAMMLPGAIYGVLMYFTGIAFIFIARRWVGP
ncbi:bile acid:sodium symporter family protein [Usitatibacter palustris]|uniref:Pantothenates transporter PanS n=1 Tax=Usitatibacter palustris TaxID=2732487 RepID=A0A6M4H3V2_9PROT|nr:bile acid:sodium symporter family protein [Usitatibacter palustris]QJR14120.1 Pantothenate precursors transporter PanS [Usitatibacter palustris]